MSNFTLDLSSLPEQLKKLEDKIDLLTEKVNKLSLPVIEDPIVIEDPVVTFPYALKVTDKTLLIENWKELCESNDEIILQDKIIHLVPNYQRAKMNHDLLVKANNKSTIIFGKDNYNQWIENTEDQVIFELGRWNNKISIQNIDPFTGKLLEQVEPFYRTLFLNSPDKGQTGTIELINSNTNMEYGFLYSGSQHEYLTATQKDINFEGIIWQEFKAKNGGGLLDFKENVNLKQIDPITHIKADLKLLNNDTFESSEKFYKIQNRFIESGNSCNILFVDNKTFYLPKNSDLDYVKIIRPIPNTGDKINIEVFINPSDKKKYFRTNSNELQVNDIIKINEIEYLLKIKDRSDLKFNEKAGYYIDFLSDNLKLKNGVYQAEVIKSTGLEILGKSISGYMIFKYNKHFQTNVDIDHGLQYMLASNPYGVLSYNNKEITIDYKNVNHNGFYRQTNGTGFSNGYRMVNCKGYGDEFKPPVTVITV